jgi:hypothetical protein
VNFDVGFGLLIIAGSRSRSVSRDTDSRTSDLGPELCGCYYKMWEIAVLRAAPGSSWVRPGPSKCSTVMCQPCCGRPDRGRRGATIGIFLPAPEQRGTGGSHRNRDTAGGHHNRRRTTHIQSRACRNKADHSLRSFGFHHFTSGVPAICTLSRR